MNNDRHNLDSLAAIEALLRSGVEGRGTLLLEWVRRGGLHARPEGTTDAERQTWSAELQARLPEEISVLQNELDAYLDAMRWVGGCVELVEETDHREELTETSRDLVLQRQRIDVADKALGQDAMLPRLEEVDALLEMNPFAFVHLRDDEILLSSPWRHRVAPLTGDLLLEAARISMSDVEQDVREWHPDPEQFFAGLDGQLSPAAWQVLQEHIGRCATCSGFLEGVEELSTETEDLARAPIGVHSLEPIAFPPAMAFAAAAQTGWPVGEDLAGVTVDLNRSVVSQQGIEVGWADYAGCRSVLVVQVEDPEIELLGVRIVPHSCATEVVGTPYFNGMMWAGAMRLKSPEDFGVVIVHVTLEQGHIAIPLDLAQEHG